ncbi:ALDH9A1 [Cordylochernes scorpioides]|uniref:ALDH9A1 n=1 Tax=Cordylochernes scorpioides TaxID=51811 RepID=A0ABY6LEH2_9ARAC|nr:ALDH9A1 [Cordylochernes scorpioides]
MFLPQVLIFSSPIPHILHKSHVPSTSPHIFLSNSLCSPTTPPCSPTSLTPPVKAQLEEIAVMETEDTGKPIWESRVDIAGCADVIQYYAGILSTALSGEIHELGHGRSCHVRKEPLGVVAGIGAWNYPFQVLAWKAAPALAAGNTIVFKPSEFTPLTAVRLAEIFGEAGAPPGVVNIVQGGGGTGQLLSRHPDISKVTFTGSVATGQAIMRDCAADMKRLTLEMGGKSALLVLADADLDLAVKATLIGNFLTQGAVCTNCTRVFVHDSLQEEFVRRLKNAARKLKVGDPRMEDTTVGATISAAHAAKVESYVTRAVAQGATLVYGGSRETVPGLEGGVYLRPCILSQCQDHMDVVQEEVFGSVVSLLTFSSVEEAIARANKSPFGLAAGVITRDLQAGQDAASQLQAGTVWVNDYNVFPPQMPFGGYKLSGLGRENGVEGLLEFVQSKSVYVNATGSVPSCPLFPSPN